MTDKWPISRKTTEYSYDDRHKVALAVRGDPNQTLIPQSREGFEYMTFHEAAYRFWDICRSINSTGIESFMTIKYDTRIVLAGLIDIPTCHNVSEDKDVFQCSECKCKAELTEDICNEYGEACSMPFMPSFCPNCGRKVTSEEDDD